MCEGAFLMSVGVVTEQSKTFDSGIRLDSGRILAPITLGGFGVRESGFSALAKRAGATAAQGASTGFATAVLVILVNAAGLMCVEIAERLQSKEPAAS